MKRPRGEEGWCVSRFRTHHHQHPDDKDSGQGNLCVGHFMKPASMWSLQVIQHNNYAFVWENASEVVERNNISFISKADIRFVSRLCINVSAIKRQNNRKSFICLFCRRGDLG